VGRKRKVALGTFEDIVERAVEKLEGGGELAEDEMNLYVQKRVLNHMECADALVLHGLVRNLGAAHFGAAEKSDDNTAEVLKDAAGRPVLPEAPFKGAMRSYLLAVSKSYGVGDAAACKTPVEGGYLDCGTCLACGIMGYMRPKGESYKSRVLVTVGAPKANPVVYCKACVVRDPTTNTVRGRDVKATIKEEGEEEAAENGEKEAAEGKKKKREKKAAVFYRKEYLAPSTAPVPLVLRVKGAAVAEVGLVVQALYHALAVDGVGGTVWTPTWKEDPKSWRLTRIPMVGEEELYTGPKLKELLGKVSYAAKLALDRRLFKPYVLAKPVEVVAR
jgi:hypothetical protein